VSPSADGNAGEDSRGKVVWSATMSLDGFIAGLGRPSGRRLEPSRSSGHCR
jgi:hypothetical protein